MFINVSRFLSKTIGLHTILQNVLNKEDKSHLVLHESKVYLKINLPQGIANSRRVPKIVLYQFEGLAEEPGGWATRAVM